MSPELEVMHQEAVTWVSTHTGAGAERQGTAGHHGAGVGALTVLLIHLGAGDNLPSFLCWSLHTLGSSTEPTHKSAGDRLLPPTPQGRLSPERRLPDGGHEQTAVDQRDVCPVARLSTQLHLHNNSHLRGGVASVEAVSLVRGWTLLAATPQRLPTQRKRRQPQLFRPEQLMEPL